ncbi:2-oxoglutarate dehydrogenase E2 component (dihydrolipoamide succinyltransferase) [Winogradskyella epiphytica]|uniref:Dihydrolipoamide acetyltransferase component of pyruvate dehydrogenase complex n=1 Tax=Winogradskyella epiphytica TaxID=262005 RepID=A0A2V4XWQ0_9FLAO|nr:dihydrolipoamide acetyltransferase family protein [Winogradskyella epiphytica]PYE80054.1 2-oxoglutarate dehydrogenase E2 component (dihydrolipoamide succinyltransferase) [Winogradskyella epiphytica]GGW71075.1 dihydrolipoamide acetyltransferase component of pyruvate dehydrogenase complex [Winogradskyella epiphytica]
MANFELKLPKMGESVAEATITSWLKEVGDTIEADEAVLEIATDKVDSEVPSEVDGVLVEKLFNVDDVVQVGQTIAVIQTEGGDTVEVKAPAAEPTPVKEVAAPKAAAEVAQTVVAAQETVEPVVSTEGRFYSPLVKNIAKQEGISQSELDAIPGTGKDNRVTKNDIKAYLETRSTAPKAATTVEAPTKEHAPTQTKAAAQPVIVSGGDEIIEMSRMGKLIAKHMVDSVQTSAHVQSFIEADVTKIWNWRKKVKDAFMKREGENLTFTPIFMEAVTKALKEFPMMNISVQGDKIIKKKDINLGMAAALPDGNLIVPVIKNADQLNLFGMAKRVNDLATRARDNKLSPDDIQGGTYTVTNVGTFGSIMGTPIINQPQVGILALGAIRKVPAVIEGPEGDYVGIRYKMFLSHSYDHRVVNGALGGQFVKFVKDYLEAWDPNQEI